MVDEKTAKEAFKKFKKELDGKPIDIKSLASRVRQKLKTPNRTDKTSEIIREKYSKLKKKQKYRKVFIESQPTLNIKQKEVPGIFSDPNRFFKSAVQDEI